MSLPPSAWNRRVVPGAMPKRRRISPGMVTWPRSVTTAAAVFFLAMTESRYQNSESEIQNSYPNNLPDTLATAAPSAVNGGRGRRLMATKSGYPLKLPRFRERTMSSLNLRDIARVVSLRGTTLIKDEPVVADEGR